VSNRVRFAPSPTGHVHIGNIRVALYNWLYARHTGGRFLLRVEDTDRERSTPEAVQTLLDAMRWLGLDYDEEPVYQSAQRDRHLAAAEQLLASGHAYKEDKGGTGMGEAVLFKMPGEDIAYDDLVKGTMRKAAKDLSDFVIVRSNGSPVFHLANVMDDIHMGITHVIRGNDHAENTFRHIALYRALGADLPAFAHLPMIVNAQGKPYSKRDGDAFVGDFRAKGYLPDALFNYLVLLGWSPGDNRELLSRDELIALFDLARVQASAAQMDVKKLDALQGHYMKQVPFETFRAGCFEALTESGLDTTGIDAAYFDCVVRVMGDRVKRYVEFPEQAGFFFNDDFPYDEKVVNKRLRKEGALDHLRALRDTFAGLTEWSAATTDAALHQLAESRGASVGEFIHPARVAVSGLGVGPGLFDMLEVLGRDRVLQRMDRTLRLFSV